MNFKEYTDSLAEKYSGYEIKTINDIIYHCNDSEQEELKRLYLDEAVTNGYDRDKCEAYFDEIVTYTIAKRNDDWIKANQPQMFEQFVNGYLYNPTQTLYTDMHHTSKHQCSRKPKPRKRGIKHGNRKK